MTRAFITGVAGTVLSTDERAFVRDARPCGLILFARNCQTVDQIRQLVSDFAEAAIDDIVVLIDQEGGRVQRMRPPLSRALPPAAAFGELYARAPEDGCRAAYLAARLTAQDLRAMGITGNCAPVLDVPVTGAHDIIGNRAYGRDPNTVATLGRAVAKGYMDGGVLPVMKHIPGHGRATADSHVALPVVTTDRATLDASDFAPFGDLRDLPTAMTAHVVYTAIDPERPASTSPQVLGGIVRSAMGFDGLLMSDDVSMQALAGSIADRTAGVIAAGCDLALHCNGVMPEMIEVAANAPPLAGPAKRRFEAALAVRARSEPFDQDAAEAAISGILALVA